MMEQLPAETGFTPEHGQAEPIRWRTETHAMLGTGGMLHPAGIGIYSKWGYSWPLNRRIIYNRASVYQTGPDEGAPLAPDKWVVNGMGISI